MLLMQAGLRKDKQFALNCVRLDWRNLDTRLQLRQEASLLQRVHGQRLAVDCIQQVHYACMPNKMDWFTCKPCEFVAQFYRRGACCKISSLLCETTMSK